MIIWEYCSWSSVDRSLSGLFCCSARPICRTAVLAGCVGQKLVRENPWQGASRCHVTNVATAGFLLSCKKFTWSVFISGVILLRMPPWLGMVLTAD